jgi:hypothetical protein
MNRRTHSRACHKRSPHMPQDPQGMLEAVAVEELKRSLLLKNWNRNQEETFDD